MKITTLIPAVYEPDLQATIDSLQHQTDRIVVALNNTDHVPNITGAELLNLGQITGRKAGALNRAIEYVSPTLADDDILLVMDADTVLSADWTAKALKPMADPMIGAVGAVFQGDRARKGWLSACQRREWERYEEEIGRTGKTFVLSGTAALIRWDTLRMVHQRFGYYYNEDSITEDMRLTLDIKAIGWDLASPTDCLVTTDMMQTIPALYRQRRRWSLGAIQNVTQLGYNHVTATYWKQQSLLLLSIVCMSLFIGLTAVLTPLYGVTVQWWTFAILAAFSLERVVTVKRLSDRIVAGFLVSELLYSLILQAAHVAAIVQYVKKNKGVW